MPPSRRRKESLAGAAKARRSPRASTKHLCGNAQNLPNEDPSVTKTSNDRSASASSNMENLDPASLDEEEIPAHVDGPGITTGSYVAGVSGYNALKSFNGQVYSGMAVGGSHVWNYDKGVWKETKVEPDLWKIDYETTKRRGRKAPEGSGAPVGTEYHWLIVAHQHVRKVDANTYETHLTGSKYKLAHKAANSNSWSIPTVKAQREREIELLDDAKRRAQGLPPVLASEKVKVERREKGQQRLDSLFASPQKNEEKAGTKRKRQVEEE